MAAHASRSSGPGAIALLSFLTPLWLAGLALLPAIRWLHRAGPPRREVAVSRLALWRGAEASRPNPGARRPPDPAWRRRALLAALLLIALAGPRWPEERVRVTLWIDDSLSMLTREASGTRLAEGLARARSKLAELAQADVDVRVLSDPWSRLGALDDATTATVLSNAGRKEPGPPPAALLRSDSQQWLLTDGADATLFAWPGGRRPDRVVQVAGVTRNVGLERLSARRHPGDPQTLDLLLKVTNGGLADEARTVVFSAGDVEVIQSDVRLAAGASRLVEATMPASSSSVRTTLQPGDALAEDDTITLDLAPLRPRRVAVDPACAKALVAAVAAHPALAVVPPGAAGAEAVLDCGTGLESTGMPTLRVIADRVPSRPPGAPRWSSTIAESRRGELDRSRLQIAAHLQARPNDSVLLALGDEPVIVERGGKAEVVETSLDIASIASGRGPELPLLVDFMFGTLLGPGLLDTVAVVDRGPRASRVAPLPELVASAAAPSTTVARASRDLIWPVLVVALLALLWEAAALARQGLRLSAREAARVT